MANLPEVPNRNAQIVQIDRCATLLMFAWMQAISDTLSQGINGTIATAPLTGPGTPGSMTFVNGVLVSQVAAT